MMAAYQAAELLRQILRQFGINETWVVQGGVDIQYRRHQRKIVESVLLAMKSELRLVDVSLKLIERHRFNFLPMTLNRKTMKIRRRKTK